MIPQDTCQAFGASLMTGGLRRHQQCSPPNQYQLFLKKRVRVCAAQAPLSPCSDTDSAYCQTSGEWPGLAGSEVGLIFEALSQARDFTWCLVRF